MVVNAAMVTGDEMDPLDIPRLNWADFLGNAPVADAYRDLKRLTSRTIALHSRSLVPGVPRSFYCAWSGAIHIFIEETSPRVHHAAVHELLHAILVEEGYCQIRHRMPTWVSEILSNEMQHPEIFRRMDRYGLDMTPYWEQWDRELGAGVQSMERKLARDRTVAFGHFPQVFTWFFFPSFAVPHLARYRECNPVLHEAAQAAYRETRGVGFENADRHRQSIEIFRRHWLRYCEDHHREDHFPEDPVGEGPVATISNSTITPIVDDVNRRPAAQIADLLKRKGLRV
jgi:hypothetical protein